jgi:pimeloyl-ACP methyl ester carboxylesterase
VLPTIGIPALLVYGGASNFYSAGTAAYVRDSIPNARCIYPDVDHAPTCGSGALRPRRAGLSAPG